MTARYSLDSAMKFGSPGKASKNEARRTGGQVCERAHQSIDPNGASIKIRGCLSTILGPRELASDLLNNQSCEESRWPQ